MEDKDEQDDGSISHEDAGILFQSTIQTDERDESQDRQDDGTDDAGMLTLGQELDQFLHRDPRSEHEDKEGSDQEVLCIRQQDSGVCFILKG